MIDLETEARKLGIQLKPDQLKQFEQYYQELVAWNMKTNLTAITTREEVYTKHFLDSLTLAPELIKRECESLVDIGTGPGFPGLALKIALPSLRVILVESAGKKAEFLAQATAILGLQGVQIVNGRAEELGQDGDYREKFDSACARAVARLPVICEYALPLLKIGGVFLAQKGETANEELESAKEAIETLGGKYKETLKAEVPEAGERYIILIEKKNPTDKKYPRKPGVPEKKPLGLVASS